MTIQEFWLGFVHFLNASAMYIVMLLGRSAFLSVPVLFVVLLLRRTVCREKAFLKGMLWCLFLPLPFMGRMRFFYETGIGVRLFIWWHELCVKHYWIGWIYLLGIAAFGIYIIYRRRRLYRFVSALRRERLGDTELFICDRNVTPFTTGLLRPRIVIPEVMAKDFRSEELQVVLLHEKIHICFGHLWVYTVWDILRVLLWINPLLTVCTRYLKEDMEDICDRAAIQRSGAAACDYGRLLLKSLRLLGNESVDVPAAFAGEREYQRIKDRMRKIVHFKPYRKTAAVISTLCCVLVVAGLFYRIWQVSYPVYLERMDISICDPDFQLRKIGDQEELRDVITIEDGYVCIRRDAWKELLQMQGITADTYYVSFGGYMKLPGVGGGGNAVYVDMNEAEEMMTIPYFNNDTVLWTRLFKLL